MDFYKNVTNDSLDAILHLLFSSDKGTTSSTSTPSSTGVIIDTTWEELPVNEE